MKKFLLLTALAVFIFIGCSKDDDNNKPNNPSYWGFIKVGNSWTYEQTQFNPDGELVDSHTYHPEIIESIKKASDVGFIGLTDLSGKIGNVVFLNQGINHWWYFNNNRLFLEDDNDRISDKDGEGFPTVYTNSYVNQTWSYEWSGYGYTQTSTRTVLSLNEQVEVPAGIFPNCIKIREFTVTNDGEYEVIRYISRQYGLIMSVTKGEGNFTDSGYTTYMKLKSKNF